MRVYVDLVFILNFLVNYLLLRGAAKLGASAVRKRRLCLAALVGAGYAVAVYLPGMGFLQTAGMKIVCAAVMLLAAYGIRRRTLRLAAVFAAVSLVLCGAVYGVELIKSGRVYFNGKSLLYPVTFSSLVLTASAVYCACHLLLPKLNHSAKSIVPVTLRLQGARVHLSALIDSGNTLCDPITGEQVLVAHWQTAKRLLPRAGLSQSDFSAPANTMVRLASYRPRLIPYRAVGTASGMLLALPCEEVKIGKHVKKNSLVAFSPTQVSDGGSYEALTGGTQYA
ncbi:MAG: sigma-E processing peptidase SpoIIGA [Oscillospiraceae bacterium]|nr:sigma-E processing peptidase SpoIIGA [Oscillospiraceae bacterium]